LTPSLFDLPVRPPVVAECAVLIFEQIGDRPVTDELRNRVAGRSALLKLEGLTPFWASLERDPIHPSAFYMAVDGLAAQPMLLRIAPSATPSSGLFPKSILIGRMPGPKGIEIVANAVPFAHTNAEAISTFVAKVNREFAPRPASAHSAIIVKSTSPQTVLPAAFEEFRSILKIRGLNLAGASDPHVASWAAIRAGWREGFITEGKDAIHASQLTERRRAICLLEIEEAAQTAQQIEQCSRFLS
jgi:hypothetical protein